MASPASASFPWSVIPEPPSGEFRSGSLPSGPGPEGDPRPGGEYLAARGSRPGIALLILADTFADYAAVHGLFRLAEVMDPRRLAGSLLIGLGRFGQAENLDDLLEPADALIVFESLRGAWQMLSTASYPLTGSSVIDRQAEEIAASSGTPYRIGVQAGELSGAAASWLAHGDRPATLLRISSNVEERAAAVERVFHGLINMLRGLEMLEGQLAPVESTVLRAPALAESPVSGYWTPAARPGQRLRINDKLGSFLDPQGRELGDLLTNISGILLGISSEVRVESGQPVAELARSVELL